MAEAFQMYRDAYLKHQSQINVLSPHLSVTYVTLNLDIEKFDVA